MAHLLKRQDQVAPMRPMPVDDKGNSSQVTTVSGETIELYYYNGSDVRTIDAGQVAGTLVEGKLVYDNIKNQSGAFEGTWQDTSFAFTSGVFVLSQQKFFDFTAAEGTDDTGGTARLAMICAGFVDGDWTLDHTSGLVYGKKATAGVTLAAAGYKVLLPVSGSGGPTANVNVNQYGGIATTLGQKTMAASMPVVIASDQSSVPVSFGGNSTVRDGTGTLAATGVAQQIIVASTTTGEVTVQNDPDNANDLFVGNAVSQSIQLSSGQSYTLNIDNANKVYSSV